MTYQVFKSDFTRFGRALYNLIFRELLGLAPKDVGQFIDKAKTKNVRVIDVTPIMGSEPDFGGNNYSLCIEFNAEGEKYLSEGVQDLFDRVNSVAGPDSATKVTHVISEYLKNEGFEVRVRPTQDVFGYYGGKLPEKDRQLYEGLLKRKFD